MTSWKRERLFGRCAELLLFSWLVMLGAGWAFAGGLEYNTNRFGGDYRRVILSKPDPKLCESECWKDASCKAFTYVKPGVQNDNAMCWLKGSKSPKSHDPNCVSGVKEITGAIRTTNAATTTGLEYDTNRPGYDYRFVVLSKPVPEMCGIECIRDSKCKAFTYVKPGVQGVQARCC